MGELRRLRQTMLKTSELFSEFAAAKRKFENDMKSLPTLMRKTMEQTDKQIPALLSLKVLKVG